MNNRSTSSVSPMDFLDRGARGGGRLDLGQPGLEPIAEPRQRGPQIMRDIARHLADILEQPLDPDQHVVERRRELVELVAVGPDRHALADPAADDRLGRAADRVQAAAEKGAEQRPPDQAHGRIPAKPATKIRITVRSVWSTQLRSAATSNNSPDGSVTARPRASPAPSSGSAKAMSRRPGRGDSGERPEGAAPLPIINRVHQARRRA